MIGDKNDLIIYYDASCNLCTGFVSFFMRFRQTETLNFIPFHIATSKMVTPNELLVINQDQAFEASAGIIEILTSTKGIAHLIGCMLKLFPIKLLNSFYYLIARNRHKWFGKKNQCSIN